MTTNTNTKPVVLSFGMGVDSAAILLRWLEDPTSRDFELDNLVVITAMVGNEFSGTGRLVEQHILPRLRKHNVRFIQVARAGLLQKDGVKVLSDSAQTDKLYIKGAYKLSDELTSAGTVPQYASGRRRCSMKAKGWPLDLWIEAEMNGREFRHVMGFNADEMRRVERDRSYSSAERHSEYPLVEWGWGRQACEDYLENLVGEKWLKSCCTFCPFAGGKKSHLERLGKNPEAATEALALEHVSLALNPRMTLFSGGKSLAESFRTNGDQDILDAFDTHLDTQEWAVYQIRRVYSSKGNARRSVRVQTARNLTRTVAEATLTEMAKKAGCTIENTAGSNRFYVHRREVDVYPAVEEFFVACPSCVKDKERKNFDKAWDTALAPAPVVEAPPAPVVKVKPVLTLVKDNSRPKAATFTPHLIQVLAEASGYQAGVGVPYKTILDKVLRSAGIDPQNSPWPLKGTKPLGLYRVVGFAFRNQKAGYIGKGQTPTCEQVGRGLWALTPAGVESALDGREAALAA
jgi:hypothetical protein